MIGIGYKLQQRTKINLLSKKAKEYNRRFNQLLQKGYKDTEIPKIISNQQYDFRHLNQDYDDQPYFNNKKLNGIGASTNLGYQNAHKTLSQTKSMQVQAKNLFLKNKDLLSDDKTIQQMKSTFNLQETKQQVKLMENQLRQRIYKDHIQQIKKGVKVSTEPIKSQYKQLYRFTNQMQKQCDHQDFTYHQKKNDLKWYSQQSVKIKGVMRK